MSPTKGYTEMKDSGIEWVGPIPGHWDILRGKNVLRLLERPVKLDDDVVTCFRDGEVTLRKNRREEGFTNSLKEIGYQGIEPGDLIVHGMDGFAGAIGISDSRGKASPVLNVMDSNQNKSYLQGCHKEKPPEKDGFNYSRYSPRPEGGSLGYSSSSKLSNGPLRPERWSLVYSTFSSTPFSISFLACAECRAA